MPTAAFSVVKTKRPLSQKVIGFRMVLAYINQAQYNFGWQEGDPEEEKMVQSFQGRFRICESGDYTDYPTPEQLSNWLGARMPEHGITLLT